MLRLSEGLRAVQGAFFTHQIALCNWKQKNLQVQEYNEESHLTMRRAGALKGFDRLSRGHS